MARQTAAQEVNAFVKGIITEASPLTFPENASIDEENIILNKDGSRRRRLGLDFEPGYFSVDSGVTSTVDTAFNSFNWKSPGGYTDREFLVIQVGNKIHIFDSSVLPVSANKVGEFTVGTSTTQLMSIDAVDGILVIASGISNITTIDFNGTTLLSSTGRLKIRDLFGVADTISGNDLLDGTNISLRPSTITAAHTYNLRNQTFAIPRYRDSVETLTDPIGAFRLRHEELIGSTKYPSNSDNVVTYLYSDANDSDDRNTKRYFSVDAVNNPLGTNRAPMGYFIIDALERGTSRLAEIGKLYGQYPQLGIPVNTLPIDTTPGGATAVSGFAGRMWFAGFSSKVNGGDTESPRMTSYVLFSKLVSGVSDIFKCYQEGDPTSAEIPDLVDTDGGFLRLDGAYNIQRMINVGDSIMVIAENGVWKITGGSGYGFNATNYLTTKITEHGCTSKGSVVVVDNTFMYWSDDGIYHVSPNQYGDWIANNLTTNTIQTFFDSIPYSSKVRCQGIYDSYQRQARWLFNQEIGNSVAPQELVLDISLSAFYKTRIGVVNPNIKPISMARIPPFTTGTAFNQVIDGSGNIVSSSLGDLVITTETGRTNSTSEVVYLTSTGISGGNLQITFSYFRDLDFKDWISADGVGVDAAGFLLTGWTGFGDFQRQKQIPYLTVYSVKTEIGFDSEWNPENASSIIVQSQWSWTNLAVAGKWSSSFQAYRHNRLWIPDSPNNFNSGELVVKTKNKLRGRGSVVSLLFKTEPEKDFHLLGWSYIVNLNGNV